VLEVLAELVPDAPAYTLVHDPDWAREAGSDALADREVHHSPLQWIPGSVKHYPKLLPLTPLAARLTRLGFPRNRGGFLIGFQPLIRPHPDAIRGRVRGAEAI